MQRAGILLALLVLSAGTAWAQQEMAPSTDSGPMDIKPVQPTPDKDGVYSVGPGIDPPKLVRGQPAVYPPDAPPRRYPANCFFSTVIGVDGIPAEIELARGCLQEKFVAPSIASIKGSQFQAGTLNGKPVPVLIHLRVTYRYGDDPQIPQIALRYNDGFGNCCGGARSNIKPPVATHMADAIYSDYARRHRIQGIVLVSALIDTEGKPTDLRVDKPLGYGLDEQALDSVRQYEFKPATKDGVPVAVRITVEVSFRLY